MKPHLKLGKRKIVFRGIVFKIQHAKATLPSGKQFTFEWVKRANTAMLLPIDPEGRLLLIRQYIPEVKKYLWTLPAGRLGEKEDPKAGAQRELREETGFRSRRLLPFYVGRSVRTMQWTRFAYLATDLVRDPLPEDEGEDIKVIPVSLTKAFQLAVDGKLESEVGSFLVMRLYVLAKQKRLPKGVRIRL